MGGFQMSNYLDIVDDDIVKKLFSIMTKPITAHEKADKYAKFLKPYGFKEVGLGTNIIVFANKEFPKVVYKFALDSEGLDDNIIDEERAKRIPRHVLFYGKHYTNLVSVQERVTEADEKDINKNLHSILKLLKKLSKEYVIVDASPTECFKNYGINDEGEWRFIDISDWIPYEDTRGLVCTNIRVNKKKNTVDECGGDAVYIDNYHRLECTECGHIFNPINLRPVYKEGKMNKNKYFTLGVNPADLAKLEARIMTKRENINIEEDEDERFEPVPPSNLFSDEDDDEDDIDDHPAHFIDEEEDDLKDEDNKETYEGGTDDDSDLGDPLEEEEIINVTSQQETTVAANYITKIRDGKSYKFKQPCASFPYPLGRKQRRYVDLVVDNLNALLNGVMGKMIEIELTDYDLDLDIKDIEELVEDDTEPLVFNKGLLKIRYNMIMGTDKRKLPEEWAKDILPIVEVGGDEINSIVVQTFDLDESMTVDLEELSLNAEDFINNDVTFIISDKDGYGFEFSIAGALKSIVEEDED
jgi:hypothetical protein